MNRSFYDYAIITLKGIAMGAADVVPGVSGGTIALIAGIYEELIDTINDINLNTVKILKNEGIKAAWKSINGNFIFSLLFGIGISVLSLAKLIRWLLEAHPILIWSFFFGLVLASIYFVAKQVEKWNLRAIFGLLLGIVIAYYITILPPLSTEVTPWFMFLSGGLAICAMILPGISGSFILVLLGAYKPVLDAIQHKNFMTLLYLIGGAIIGLLSFSRLLKWLFDNYKNTTLALLAGFIIGSLNKVWPWKKVLLSEVINGKLKIIQEQSVSPFAYSVNNHLYAAIVLALIGFMLIVLLEKVSTRKDDVLL